MESQGHFPLGRANSLAKHLISILFKRKTNISQHNSMIWDSRYQNTNYRWIINLQPSTVETNSHRSSTCKTASKFFSHLSWVRQQLSFIWYKCRIKIILINPRDILLTRVTYNKGSMANRRTLIAMARSKAISISKIWKPIRRDKIPAMSLYILRRLFLIIQQAIPKPRCYSCKRSIT